METHLSTDIESEKVHMPKYTLLRKDMKEGNQARFPLYIRYDLTPKILLLYSNALYDTIIAYIKQQNVVICYTYFLSDAPNHICKVEDCLARIRENLIKL